MDSLKRKLQSSYPEQLVFSLNNNRRSMSQLVHASTASAEDIANAWVRVMTYETDSSSDDSVGLTHSFSFNSLSSFQSAGSVTEQQELMNTALMLRTAVSTLVNQQNPLWPPSLESLSMTAMEQQIPIPLYNFVAILINATDDIEDFLLKRAAIPPPLHRKVISLCQDLVFAIGRGKIQTPKSLVLGLALRHLAGNKTISQIISRFGHCSSYDTVLRLETAMARQSQISSSTPHGFQQKVWTTAVWDNIDFCEETISGGGTTHFVNGILVQSPLNRETLTSPVSGESICRRMKRLPSESVPQETIFWNKNMRTGPIPATSDFSPSHHNANLIDTIYCFLKHVNSEPGGIPAWTQFNQKIDDTDLPLSLIHYLPVIESPATDMSTINTILVRSIEIADKLELSKIVIVCDLAVYTKIQDLRWKSEVYRSRTIIRLGEFHTLMSFLGVLGKRFGDAGLADILIEADVVAGGSIGNVLTGHEYNRSIRSHKLFYEAIERLRIDQFLSTLDHQTREKYTAIFSTIADSLTAESFGMSTTNSLLTNIMDAYSKHVTRQCETNPTYAFWSSYCDAVTMMLDFVRATRTSDWELHITTIKKMIPYYFSYDQKNYRR